jgi:phosphoglycolate phosphatase
VQTMSSMQKLILWDIDSTLLTTNGIAAEMMRESMRQLFGTSPSKERSIYAGKTDRQIILETFPNLSSDQLDRAIADFAALYTKLLREQHDELLAKAQVLAGARELLSQFHGQAYQGVLTGNISTIAQYKLEVVGLDSFIDLEASAFGSDHHERAALLPIALERAARRYGRTFDGSDVIIVGDTPNDVACGKAGGARTVAVATGIYTLEQLQACEPDLLLANLSHPETAQKILAL